MDPRDPFVLSCETFQSYPTCLIRPNALNHTAQAYHARLSNQSGRLFDERQAAIDFLDIDGGAQDHCVKSLLELKLLLRQAFRPGRSDPLCRFVFLHAPHSRAALRTSLDMFNFLFTYHQIMASFLDFVFPFGKQVYAKDFHFSGFREESRFARSETNTGVPRLGRSGIGLSLCYNLRSVESSRVESGLPWSIRQTAVYHEFDLDTGRTLWIIVKGNKLIKKRMSESSTAQSAPRIDSRSTAFSASLASHLLLCDWAGENWRWYINDLEEEMQNLTRDIVATPVDAQIQRSILPLLPVASGKRPRSRSSTFQSLSRATTDTLYSVSRAATGGLARASSTKYQLRSGPPSYSSRSPTIVYAGDPLTQHPVEDNHALDYPRRSASSIYNIKHDRRSSNWVYGPGKSRSFMNRLWPRTRRTRRLATADVEMGASCPPPAGCFATLDASSPRNEEKAKDLGIHTFSDLQRIPYLEEKAQEALLVLKMNTTVLEELKEHYKYAANNAGFPIELNAECHDDLARFERCVSGVEKDLRLLQSRTETLLSLLANRKSLLEGIFQYRGAKQAQASADQMERMTAEMHDLAKKTKQETVSMRVITSVTLFFLPATFIATFMSTDILKFEHGKSDFQIQGLGTYLAIALPLTVLTFFAWYLIYIFARKREAATVTRHNHQRVPS